MVMIEVRSKDDWNALEMMIEAIDTVAYRFGQLKVTSCDSLTTVENAAEIRAKIKRYKETVKIVKDKASSISGGGPVFVVLDGDIC